VVSLAIGTIRSIVALRIDRRRVRSPSAKYRHQTIPIRKTRRNVRFESALRRIELSLSDRQSDPVKDGWDIVVRAGELPAEGEMTVRKLCDVRLGLYASSDYLVRHAPIASVDDFSGHAAIIFRACSGKARPWTMLNGTRTFETATPASLITGDGRAFADAAIAGMGIAQIFDRLAAPHVESGELQHVLPQADVNGPPIHALIPAGRGMPPKTRVVLDHLAEFFKRPM
jgi:DNA-binding transcriptional LysR family regulator